MKSEKKRKERKEKETTGRTLGPLHSHETLRGRGRSCWIKADKKFANRAKRKRKRRKRKEKCAYMCEQTWHHLGTVLRDVVKVFPVSSSLFARKTTGRNRARSHSGGMTRPKDEMGSQIVSSEYDISYPMLCFFLSRYVRAATLLLISQARKWSP